MSTRPDLNSKSPNRTCISVGKRRMLRAQSLDGVLLEEALNKASSRVTIVDDRHHSNKNSSTNINNNNSKKRPFYRSQSRKIFLTAGGTSHDSVIILKEPEIRRMSEDGLTINEEDDEDFDDEDELETTDANSFKMTTCVTRDGIQAESGDDTAGLKNRKRRRRRAKKGLNIPTYCTK